ncbi:DNA-binding response regulator [Clostridium beijerinckii]|jgi:DNA-binding NarL/FixJ family response regulator|uniref:Stage 0 sporulation protein A homolog n=1 Tax=Clostridium beijerinckii TaxID=1520 RepID=A0AB74VCH4_CLOBE|nr:response regulator transcription factor [Clostridium beijerinckii]MCI1578168.1 response regulator transcription factor [Clostridium beijerinckii]MCI1586056.1 response regulator transcription factor [Clostridium beijerinckii]MCI1620925.1 response regulator transcription factor [Clostridium beijerinckii]NRZ28386.1 DNA-binding NarL/FixJ family response regulator [Clostridium beijerinckii]NYB95837.1 DNA-binding NarL/FixJ family response regulator [Clostridium beijerinckii]
MINVVLVDDQQIVREGLKIILSLDNEINILKEAENGKQLLKILQEIQPDIILMDIRMPFMNGVEATKIVKEKYNNIKVIILTTFNEDEYVLQGIRNGADGYILKDARSHDIIKAIKAAYNGDILLDPAVTTKLIRAFNSMSIDKQNPRIINKQKKKLELLTQREMDVAKLVAQGNSNKDICHTLFLTEGTVKNYLTNIFEKLELSSRTELALFINQIEP